jgi:hypothetical protein
MCPPQHWRIAACTVSLVTPDIAKEQRVAIPTSGKTATVRSLLSASAELHMRLRQWLHLKIISISEI